MKLEQFENSLLFSTTSIPDAFFTEYYSQASRCRTTNTKSNTLTASGNDKNNIWLEDYKCRTLHPIEAERLQTLPDNYTSCLTSKVKRSEVCGNGWTVDVITHIFKNIKN